MKNVNLNPQITYTIYFSYLGKGPWGILRTKIESLQEAQEKLEESERASLSMRLPHLHKLVKVTKTFEELI